MLFCFQNQFDSTFCSDLFYFAQQTIINFSRISLETSEFLKKLSQLFWSFIYLKSRYRRFYLKVVQVRSVCFIIIDYLYLKHICSM